VLLRCRRPPGVVAFAAASSSSALLIGTDRSCVGRFPKSRTNTVCMNAVVVVAADVRGVAVVASVDIDIDIDR